MPPPQQLLSSCVSFKCLRSIFKVYLSIIILIVGVLPLTTLSSSESAHSSTQLPPCVEEGWPNFCFALKNTTLLDESAQKELARREKKAHQIYCDMVRLLTKYDCGQPYSVNQNQSQQCQEAYRDWACSVIADSMIYEPGDEEYDPNGKQHHSLMPFPSCDSICHRVLRVCPYLTPDRVQLGPSGQPALHPSQYGGHPAFYCPASTSLKVSVLGSRPDAMSVDARYFYRSGSAVNLTEELKNRNGTSCCWTYTAALKTEQYSLYEEDDEFDKSQLHQYFAADNRVLLQCVYVASETHVQEESQGSSDGTSNIDLNYFTGDGDGGSSNSDSGTSPGGGSSGVGRLMSADQPRALPLSKSITVTETDVTEADAGILPGDSSESNYYWADDVSPRSKSIQKRNNYNSFLNLMSSSSPSSSSSRQEQPQQHQAQAQQSSPVSSGEEEDAEGLYGEPVEVDDTETDGIIEESSHHHHHHSSADRVDDNRDGRRRRPDLSLMEEEYFSTVSVRLERSVNQGKYEYVQDEQFSRRSSASSSASRLTLFIPLSSLPRIKMPAITIHHNRCFPVFLLFLLLITLLLLLMLLLMVLLTTNFLPKKLLGYVTPYIMPSSWLVQSIRHDHEDDETNGNKYGVLLGRHNRRVKRDPSSRWCWWDWELFKKCCPSFSTSHLPLPHRPLLIRHEEEQQQHSVYSSRLVLRQPPLLYEQTKRMNFVNGNNNDDNTNNKNNNNDDNTNNKNNNNSNNKHNNKGHNNYVGNKSTNAVASNDLKNNNKNIIMIDNSNNNNYYYNKKHKYYNYSDYTNKNIVTTCSSTSTTATTTLQRKKQSSQVLAVSSPQFSQYLVNMSMGEQLISSQVLLLLQLSQDDEQARKRENFSSGQLNKLLLVTQEMEKEEKEEEEKGAVTDNRCVSVREHVLQFAWTREKFKITSVNNYHNDYYSRININLFCILLRMESARTPAAAATLVAIKRHQLIPQLPSLFLEIKKYYYPYGKISQPSCTTHSLRKALVINENKCDIYIISSSSYLKYRTFSTQNSRTTLLGLMLITTTTTITTIMNLNSGVSLHCCWKPTTATATTLFSFLTYPPRPRSTMIMNNNNYYYYNSPLSWNKLLLALPLSKPLNNNSKIMKILRGVAGHDLSFSESIRKRKWKRKRKRRKKRRWIWSVLLLLLVENTMTTTKCRTTRKNRSRSRNVSEEYSSTIININNNDSATKIIINYMTTITITTTTTIIIIHVTCRIFFRPLLLLLDLGIIMLIPWLALLLFVLVALLPIIVIVRSSQCIPLPTIIVPHRSLRNNEHSNKLLVSGPMVTNRMIMAVLILLLIVMITERGQQSIHPYWTAPTA